MKRERGWIRLCGAVLAAATALAYANALRAPFVFDDMDSIQENPSIRRLASWRILNPPHGGITASGRPLFNATLALNWAWSGVKPWSYHLVNIAGHILAGLLLFGVVRRTLRRLGDEGRAALGWAAAVAGLWLLHPLQTEAVTYIVQRTEMMMALFYLAVLYCLIRLAEGQERQTRSAAVWGAAGVLACLAGMLSKEVMVSAPLIALLFDRAFIAGSFGEAWRQRGRFYAALALTWIPLFAEVWANRDRGGTSGLDVGLAPWQYWLTQGPAVVRYLRLAAWPNPLVLDYGFEKRWLSDPAAALPADLAVLGLAALAIWLLVRAPRWGFLAVFFFAILAPTSLVPGNRQSLAEHRMYLALAPLLVAGVLGLRRLVAPRRWPAAAVLIGLLGAGYAVRVHARNEDYEHPETLWRDNLRYTPHNPFARCNLGAALYAQGRLAEAAREFRQAAADAPTYSPAESNLGVMLVGLHRPEEALSHLQRALELDPRSYQAMNNMGVALAALKRWPEALAWYERALAVHPDYPDARRNLAEGRLGMADDHFQRGLRLAAQGHYREAIAAYAESLKWNAQSSDAWADTGVAWLALGDSGKAVAALQRAVALAPDSAPCHYNLALALKAAGRAHDALLEDGAAARLDPDLPQAATNFAVALAEEGRDDEGISVLRAFLARHPADPLAGRALQVLLARKAANGSLAPH